ncbi:cyclic peptide export ABC transporter [Chitinophaga rhizophila]|uniref:Cyclic peptide export ABC transporter n=1 Tax=Chitinophaga rhizophila TaxID=2866212 RepID=A0ABS7GHM4_9BACT|nr:cyclic peptide export ABC transporter [Chitinophaga rhizophila]MBW8687192.1 cyclic peptide export ABC transporter [Chitinophaga rhizophila]
MALYHLLFKVHFRKFLTFAVAGCISGIASSGLLITINNQLAPSSAASGTNDALYFAGLLLIFVVSTRLLSGSVIRFTQQQLGAIRLEMTQRIVGSDYTAISDKQSRIYACLTRDVVVLSECCLGIVELISAIIVFSCCIVYLGILSVQVLLATMLLILAGLLLYLLNRRSFMAHLSRARDTEEHFVRHLEYILGGFKEIKVNPAKGSEIFESEIRKDITDSIFYHRKGITGMINNNFFVQLSYYSFIGCFLFGVSDYLLHGDPVLTTRLVFLLLFILKPLETILMQIPGVAMANVAASRIIDMKDELNSSGESISQLPVVSDPPLFQSLHYQDISFSYESKGGDTPFRLGPINMQVEKGGITFIHGGNGSGKTTFLKVLLQMLPVSEGRILLNGYPITSANKSDYLCCFSVVFSDYYLFDKLYGISDPAISQFRHYLALFEMAHKVDLKERTFSTINLSAGQRKRLALIAALMENRPVLVLDEWAADQDPVFRRRFYEIILPSLISEGRTIIAITHDDAYFHVAHHLYRMDTGVLTETPQGSLV